MRTVHIDELAAEPNSLRRKLAQILFEDTVGLHPRLHIGNLLTRLLPEPIADEVRVALFRRMGFRIGAGTVVRGQPRINGGKQLFGNLTIGRDCIVDRECTLDLEEQITIGDRVAIGYQAMLLTSSHEIGPKDQRAGTIVRAPIRIEDGARLGARCIILPGVTVGAGAVVAVGALVTKDVAAHTHVAGTPAKVVAKP